MGKLYITALLLISSISLFAQISFEQVLPPSPAPQIVPVFEAVDSSAIAFADVDGNGTQDVLIIGLNSADERIAKLYINSGGGNYTESTSSTFSGASAGSVAFADVDGNGSQDVVISGATGTIDNEFATKLYINDGSGVFTESAEIFDGVTESAIAFADVDGNGSQDLFVTGRNSANAQIGRLYINDGSGVFEEDLTALLSRVNKGSVAFADVDDNGTEDVIISGFTTIDTTPETITELFLNDGTGEFTKVAGAPFEGVRDSDIAFADVDGNDSQDLMITGFNSANQRITKLYTNDGDGIFSEVAGTSFDALANSSIAFSDVEGNGSQDVLITGSNISNQPVSKLYLNNGSGDFTLAAGTPFEAVRNSAIAFADINGDGSEDVLITGLNGSSQTDTKLYTNDGSGNFSEATGTPFDGVRRSAVAFADVDGDGNTDVLITGRNISNVAIAKLYTSDAAGIFTEVIGTPFTGVENGAVAFADVDGVNGLDVLITGVTIGLPQEFIANLYLNDGSGGFTLQTTSFPGLQNGTISFADVDGINGPDVLLTGFDVSINQIAKLYKNDGSGNFSEVGGTPFSGVQNGSVAFVDINGANGIDVLITGRSGAGEIAELYTNNGSGVFTEIAAATFEGVKFSALAFADVDGVNGQDVLITGLNSASQRTAKLYTNNGDETFTEVAGTPFTGVDLSAIAFSDLDGNGSADVMITGAISSSESISKLYTNDGSGVFTEVASLPFEGVKEGAIAFSDVAGSSLEDVLITGRNNSGLPIAKLFKNTTGDIIPTITSASTATTAENAVGTVYTATADEAVTFTLGTFKDEALFTLSTAAISFTDAPDFETPLDAAANNVYFVDVIATNGSGNSTTLQVAITVTDEDDTAPVLTSASTADFAENSTGTAYTVIATDANSITYSLGTGNDEALFDIVGSTGVVTFKAAPDFENPIDANTDNGYVINVIANDGSNEADQNVTITVTNVDEPGPTITSGATATIAENATGTVYTATADEMATFTLGSSKDEALFTLATDAISFTNAPDFESPLDANTDNIYLVDVIATDGDGNATTLEVAISVTDVAEAGPTITSPSTASVAENGTGTIYTATSDEAVTFTLGSSKDEALFNLATDAISFTDSPDFETPLDANTDNVYLVDIIATDGDGNETTKTISITVTDIDEVNPTITSVASGTVEENITGNFYKLLADEPVTYILGTSKDEMLFALAVDDISFVTPPDFETPQDGNGDNIYLFDVIATDEAGNTSTLEIAITVSDVVEPGPVFTSSAAVAVGENVTAVVYTAVVDVAATFSLGSSKDEALFTLSTDAISFISAPDFEMPLDANTDNVYLVDVIATDGDGNSTTKAITITVTDLDEVAPIFTSVATATVEENVTGIVYTAVVDEEATFSLGSSKDEALFTLATDAISFINSPDFEVPVDDNTDNVYLVDVIATDGEGNSTTQAITITVTDLDEVAPIITSATTATVEENVTGVVYTGTADEEVTFSLGSDKDEALFTLSTDAISFTAAPDFETPIDANADNVYLIELTATDAEGNATTLQVAISVTDLEEVPLANKEELLFNIYPNPFINRLVVEAKSAILKDAMIVIMDLSGKNKRSIKYNGGYQELDLSALKAGVYILAIPAEGGIAHFKIVKE